MNIQKPKLTREMIRQGIAEMERLGLVRLPKNHPKYKNAVPRQTKG